MTEVKGEWGWLREGVPPDTRVLQNVEIDCRRGL
jgi:hypothetical protein